MTEENETLPVRPVERTYQVQDMTLRSDGSGRIVEAYAAVFNTKTEIHDQEGHYHEELDSASFNRTMQHKGLGFGVLFNHGRTVDGAPYPAASMPVGVPLEVKSDGKGVFTATRYLDNPLADWTLDAIKNGAIKAQSFSGRFLKSSKSYPQGRSRGMLPVIRRMEVDMREYGPAVFAAYVGAEILGTRTADMFVRSLLAVRPEDRLDWLQQFEGAVTLLTEADSATDLGTPNGLAATQTVDSQSRSTSERSALARKIRTERIKRGI